MPKVKRGRGRPPEPVRVSYSLTGVFTSSSKGEATALLDELRSAIKPVKGAQLKADIAPLPKRGRPRKDAA